ncbi:MAG: aminomethyltransferase family protein [Acidobacteria bacterium]|nr:aminomethyltransferase family protein [Acidobacteriota bacterium]MCI0624562.1 aminomethyltransferase family protein [Acidobacteriota bacterium]MCI0717572.1 aminomethyltransferase family protein [Acidobacteriota bacterium]
MPKKLQLHETHQAAGAVFTEFFGWEVPQQFSSVENEYETLRHSAGLIDLSCSGIFELKGDDRTRFLHGMVTNDIKSLTPGSGCYAAFLSPQGRMVADLRVFCLEESLILETEPSAGEKLAPALRKYIIGDRPQLLDRSEELALLSLQGPKATEQLARLVSQPLALEGSCDHLETTLAGANIRVCRVNRTSAGGYDFIMNRQSLPLVWHSILKIGKADGLLPAGFEGFNVHRIEAGIPYYGLDMEENTLPIEAGLERNAISFTKGCYIGQESVARITYRGHVNRKLSGFRFSGSRPASKGDKIFKSDQEVGWITSSAYSPRLLKAIALGYLRREVLEPGTGVLVETSAGTIEAEVTLLPFVVP